VVPRRGHRQPGQPVGSGVVIHEPSSLPHPGLWVVTIHAVDRMLERHPDRFPKPSHSAARAFIFECLALGRFESWSAGDLGGLGQGVYRCGECDIRLVVDGDGVVRTVLP
jgi:hypothetical protein